MTKARDIILGKINLIDEKKNFIGSYLELKKTSEIKKISNIYLHFSEKKDKKIQTIFKSIPILRIRYNRIFLK